LSFPVKLEPVPGQHPDVSKVVYSPHTFGPTLGGRSHVGIHASEEIQHRFNDPAFPANLPSIWEQHWGYLQKLNVPLIVGEFGGTDADKDIDFQHALVSYIAERGIGAFYATLNPQPSTAGFGGLLLNWNGLDPDPAKVLLLAGLPATLVPHAASRLATWPAEKQRVFFAPTQGQHRVALPPPPPTRTAIKLTEPEWQRMGRQCDSGYRTNADGVRVCLDEKTEESEEWEVLIEHDRAAVLGGSFGVDAKGNETKIKGELWRSVKGRTRATIFAVGFFVALSILVYVLRCCATCPQRGCLLKYVCSVGDFSTRSALCDLPEGPGHA